jgi:GDPmannose 4,6-dehydratase
MGLQKELFLGNLEARRDWGYAKDFVEAMWLAVQNDTPEDFVVATGESHSVRELCEEAFGNLGLDYGDFVRLDPRYLRPSEVDHLQGDASKARKALGWAPRTSFKELIKLMVESDLELARKEARH